MKNKNIMISLKRKYIPTGFDEKCVPPNSFIKKTMLSTNLSTWQ